MSSTSQIFGPARYLSLREQWSDFREQGSGIESLAQIFAGQERLGRAAFFPKDGTNWFWQRRNVELSAQDELLDG